MLRRRLTYANLISTIALFIALGGVSYAAAVTLPKNSVGTKQLRRRAVTLSKIAPSARTALRGQKGDTGAIGARGPAGADASTHLVIRAVSGAIPATVGDYGNATASCNPGERATGGGAAIAGVHGQLTDSIPASNPPTSWFGQAKSDGTADSVNVYVVCASP